MDQPLFRIPMADIERGDQHLSWPIPRSWLTRELGETEATPGEKDGQLTAFLSKNGREVLVQAKARVDLVMPCARTLDPVAVAVEAPIYLLLTPRPGAAPERPGARHGRRRRGAPRADTPDASSEAELSHEDAARDTYEGDEIVLDAFVREHIILELPMFPLRSDLRSEDSPARAAPSAEPEPRERAVDPRLAPLAHIAARLREKKE